MKKVLALVLVAVLSLGMMVTSFAAKAGDLKSGSSAQLQYGASGTALNKIGDNKDADVSDPGNMVAGPDTRIYFDLSESFTVGSGQKLTESALRTDKITVKKTISKGSSVIRDIEFFTDKGRVFVRVRFVEELVGTKDVDFDFTVYLAKDGSRQRDTDVTISGTFKNQVIEASEDDDYVFSGDKVIIEAKDYVRGIEVDGGNGVSLKTNLFDGKKYYFTVSMDIDSNDDAMMNKYPEIEAVYNLKQVGFSTSGKIVKMDIDDKLYVYDVDGKYLGTTADMLTFSKKMYVSSKKIDMVVSSGADDDDDGAIEEPVSSAPITNNNNNPDTGVNGFANIAVVAGVVALAAAGAVAFKK